MNNELRETPVRFPVPGDEIELEGRLSSAGAAPRCSAVVAPPHPLMGGSLDNPVVFALVAGLAGGSCRTLRFNWRGVGASTGTASAEIADGVADYAAAAACVRAAIEQPDGGGLTTIAAGYSFGSVAAVHVAAADASIGRLVLIAPPLGMVEMPELADARIPVHVIVGDGDEYAPVLAIESALSGLDDARLDVLAGVDHFFAFGGAERITELVGA